MTLNKVLIVDDTESSLKLLASTLAAEGIETRTAADAFAAMGVLETWLPDLIVLDVRMPGIDGLDLGAALKKYSRTRSIPRVLLSAHDRPHASDIAAGGYAGFIAKPIDTRTVAAELRRLVESAAKSSAPGHDR